MGNEYRRARAQIEDIRQRQIEAEKAKSAHVLDESKRTAEERKNLKNWMLGQENAIGALLVETNKELFAGKGVVSQWEDFSETKEYGVSGFEEYKTTEGVKKSLTISNGTNLCVFIFDSGVEIGLRSRFKDAKYLDSSPLDEFLPRTSDIEINKTREAILNVIVKDYERNNF